MRVVADTNVVMSTFLWGGPPADVLNAARQQRITLYCSASLIAELEDVLSRDKFAARLKQVGSSVTEMLGDYRALLQWVTPHSVPRVVLNDPDDDHVLACALTAKADLIVSGDRKHLLSLGSYQGIDIVNAAEALRRFAAA